jgi:PKD repeat protein
LARNGILITAGSGIEITAYRFDSFAKPVADFFADHTETAINQTVNFFDQSSFEPTSWAWEFDGGSPAVSTEQHPADILFSEPGIHDVTLVSTNSFGSDTLRKSCYIRSDDVTGNTMIHLEELAWYPNPSDRFLSITGLQAGCMIEITTLQGKQILKQEAGSEKLTIDVSGLSPSVYLITARDAAGQVIARSKFLRR